MEMCKRRCSAVVGLLWSWLEPAVSGMGQPRPLLTEATLQPPCQRLGTDTLYN